MLLNYLMYCVKLFNLYIYLRNIIFFFDYDIIKGLSKYFARHIATTAQCADRCPAPSEVNG